MEIKITENRTESYIKKLAQAFDCDFMQDCKEYRIEIPECIGHGYISAYDFDYGISLVYYECFFKEELDLLFTENRVHPMHFHFCVKGEIRHQICDEQITYQLNPLNGSLSTNPQGCTQHISFSPNVEIVHTNLQIIRSEYLEKVDCDLENTHQKLEEVFRDVASEKSFLHEINYNLPTAECIRNIAGNEYDGLVRSSFAEAKCLELLALQLKQYSDDLDPDVRYVTLKKYDLDKIIHAKNILISDLQNAPTIVDLSKKSGVNQQKLKEGFKQVFGKTINQYLRDSRLETAKFLILDGRSSIQDIAERVGYCNQSHFARKFREKYGLLPKDALQANAIEVDIGKEEEEFEQSRISSKAN